MRGRTMYVLPFSMGPIGSPMSQIGVQLTDSPYVVVNMRIMARIGTAGVRGNRQGREARRALHAQRRRAARARADRMCPGPATRKSTSFTSPKRARSGPTARATAATRCSARNASRCASPRTSRAMKAGWPSTCSSSASKIRKGEKTYVAAAFPSACGKTNFAMLIPPEGFEGWKVWTVGDDIAWIKPDANGRLRAINPEAGLLRRRAGHVGEDQPQRDGHAVAEHDLHQRRAHARRRRLVGRHDRRAAGRMPRLAGQPLDAGDRQGDRRESRASRTRASPRPPRSARPSIRPGKIPKACRSARFIFGGRRATTMPLVYQAFNWSAGVYIGATMGSEMTAAAAGTVGKVRRDPMAMLPFCGYHMGDYFRHWIKMQRSLSETPRIFHVNWFRKDADGKFLWPGFRRKHARAEVDRRSRPRPRPGQGNAHRLDAALRRHRVERPRFSQGEVRRSCRRSTAPPGATEVIGHEELFIELHDHLPPEMVYERELLICRL